MNNKNVFLIGFVNVDNDDTIDEGCITTKSNKLNTNKLGNLKVEVRNGEGPVPHMHIYNPDKSFGTCICIYEPLYFDHGGKYRNKFTAAQLKDFEKWLDKKVDEDEEGNSITNWDVVSVSWQANNPDQLRFYHNTTKKRPQYKNMKNFRSV